MEDDVSINNDQIPNQDTQKMVKELEIETCAQIESESKFETNIDLSADADSIELNNECELPLEGARVRAHVQDSDDSSIDETLPRIYNIEGNIINDEGLTNIHESCRYTLNIGKNNQNILKYDKYNQNDYRNNNYTNAHDRNIYQNRNFNEKWKRDLNDVDLPPKKFQNNFNKNNKRRNYNQKFQKYDYGQKSNIPLKPDYQQKSKFHQKNFYHKNNNYYNKNDNFVNKNDNYPKSDFPPNFNPNRNVSVNPDFHKNPNFHKNSDFSPNNNEFSTNNNFSSNNTNSNDNYGKNDNFHNKNDNFVKNNDNYGRNNDFVRNNRYENNRNFSANSNFPPKNFHPKNNHNNFSSKSNSNSSDSNFPPKRFSPNSHFNHKSNTNSTHSKSSNSHHTNDNLTDLAKNLENISITKRNKVVIKVTDVTKPKDENQTQNLEKNEGSELDLSQNDSNFHSFQSSNINLSTDVNTKERIQENQTNQQEKTGNNYEGQNSGESHQKGFQQGFQQGNYQKNFNPRYQNRRNQYNQMNNYQQRYKYGRNFQYYNQNQMRNPYPDMMNFNPMAYQGGYSGQYMAMGYSSSMYPAYMMGYQPFGPTPQYYPNPMDLTTYQMNPYQPVRNGVPYQEDPNFQYASQNNYFNPYS